MTAVDLYSYFNEHSHLIGHDDADVRAWLAAHPGYHGAIYINAGDGSDDREVTEAFFPIFDDIADQQALALAGLDRAIENIREIA